MTTASSARFKPYPAYKDSGVEWLGDIPAHWETKRLWHLTPAGRRIMYGIVLPGPNVENGVPIVKGGDVSGNRLRLDSLSRTTFEIESGYARSRLRRGDLVYAIRGSIGEVAVVPAELEGANLTQDAARVAFTPKTHGPWLLHALKSMAVFRQLEAGALGATIKGINIRDLNLGPEHRVTLGQMMDRLDADVALDASARVNTRENVRLTFDQKVEHVIQEIVDTNFDLYKRITDDWAFGEVIKNMLFDQYIRTRFPQQP